MSTSVSAWASTMKILRSDLSMWTPLILVLLGACFFAVGALMTSRSDGRDFLGFAGALIILLGMAVVIVGLFVGWYIVRKTAGKG